MWYSTTNSKCDYAVGQGLFCFLSRKTWRWKEAKLSIDQFICNNNLCRVTLHITDSLPPFCKVMLSKLRWKVASDLVPSVLIVWENSELGLRTPPKLDHKLGIKVCCRRLIHSTALISNNIVHQVCGNTMWISLLSSIGSEKNRWLTT